MVELFTTIFTTIPEAIEHVFRQNYNNLPHPRNSLSVTEIKDLVNFTT